MSRAAGDAGVRLTRARRERKYVVPRAQLTTVRDLLDGRLSRHRFQGEGSNGLPRADHYITSIYFDTASGAVRDAARRGSKHVKLRARQYYDLHPDLIELATSAGDVTRASPVLWLELKSRDGDRSGKRRVGIPRDDLEGFFQDGVITERMRSIQAAEHGEQAPAVFDALQAFRESFGEPLRPACIVQYRRLAWQAEDDALRVTLDRDLRVYAAEHLFGNCDPLSLMQATPIHQERDGILEVKSTGSWPEWLERELHALGISAREYSKFLTAADAAAAMVPGAPG